ncbi:MAG TPA: FeoA family protein [Thermoplasmata archaeon]|nr:FeoA family protein [Thermoplasmata archaeon]
MVLQSPQALHGISLDELPLGSRGTILDLTVDPDLRRQLYALGILEGREIRVLRRAPLEGALLVSVGPAQYALGPEVAAHILVTRG